MNKQVLIVTSHFSPNVGGVETHLDDLVRALAKRGWEVVVSCYKPLARGVKVSFIEKKKNLTIYRMPWVGLNIVHLLTPYPPIEFIYLFPGLFLITLYSVIKYPEIKVLHAQGLVPTVIALIIARATGRRVVSSTHNLYFFPEKGLYTRFARYIFNSVDKVLTLSNASSDELKRIGVDPNKINDFRYWLDLNLFRPGIKGKYRDNRFKGNFVVFFVGRLIETKGIKILLEAAKKLKNEKIVFVFAGLGPLRTEVEKSTKNGKIVYLGRLEPEGVKKYMNISDIVCVPSTVDEGYGRVAMEAIACGTPVVASDVGGLKEVVNDNVGWTVKPNVVKITKLLKDLSTDSNEVKTKTKNARKYALLHFSKKNVEKIIKAYES